MPDGSEGLESDASLVTIAVQQDLDAAETSRAIEAMRNVIIAMIKEIKEEGKLHKRAIQLPYFEQISVLRISLEWNSQINGFDSQYVTDAKYIVKAAH